MNTSNSPHFDPLLQEPDDALERWVVEQAGAVGMDAVITHRFPELLEATRTTRANLAALSEDLQRIGSGERPGWEL